MEHKKGILGKLFLSTLYLSAFTFGGGYVIVTLMQKKFVDEFKWIEEDEMLDLVAIAQSAPGAMAVNGAIVIGYKLAGILGIIVSVLATVIPPFTIISVISLFYDAFITNTIVANLLEGMQAGVGAVIAVVVIDMFRNIFLESKVENPIIFLLAFSATYFLNISVIYIIIYCIFYGLFKVILSHRREAK